LSFCRRGRAQVDVQSARDFIGSVREQKRPEPWQLEDWKEAIRWFFVAGKEQSAMETAAESKVWLPQSSQGWPRVEGGISHHAPTAQVFLSDRGELPGMAGAFC
jgi:hypothetical protein